MKFIDESGNLFGSINVIDAIVVVAVVSATVSGMAFAFGINPVQIVMDQTETTSAETVNRTISVEVQGVPPYTSEAIPAEGTATHSSISVLNKTVRPTTVFVTNESGHFQQQTHPYKKSVTMTLRVQATKMQGDTTFRGTSLKVARTLTLDFENVTVKSTITEV